MWKGGVRCTKGRVFFKIEGRKWPIARARKVMEDFLGRELLSTEIVHHINGITNDDRIENLVMTNRRAHVIHHHTGAKRSEETKRKIGIKSIGRKHPNRKKGVRNEG